MGTLLAPGSRPAWQAVAARRPWEFSLFCFEALAKPRSYNLLKRRLDGYQFCHFRHPISRTESSLWPTTWKGLSLTCCGCDVHKRLGCTGEVELLGADNRGHIRYMHKPVQAATLAEYVYDYPCVAHAPQFVSTACQALSVLLLLTLVLVVKKNALSETPKPMETPKNVVANTHNEHHVHTREAASALTSTGEEFARVNAYFSRFDTTGRHYKQKVVFAAGDQEASTGSVGADDEALPFDGTVRPALSVALKAALQAETWS